MSKTNPEAAPALVGSGPSVFATTHWSVVLTAGQSDLPQAAEALEKLRHAYWYPLYVYVRRQGNSPEDAQDLTQEFFSRLLAKNFIAKADRNRGMFRTFLLRSLKNFMVNEWKRVSLVSRWDCTRPARARNGRGPCAPRRQCVRHRVRHEVGAAFPRPPNDHG